MPVSLPAAYPADAAILTLLSCLFSLQISDFHNVIHLLIQQVPPTSQATRMTVSEDGTASADENSDEASGIVPSDGASM